MPTCLYCDATTPVDPRVRHAVVEFIDLEFGKAGSRIHELRSRSKQAVQRTREDFARAAHAKPDEVVFSSGTTGSNTIAIRGLPAQGHAPGYNRGMPTVLMGVAVHPDLQGCDSESVFALCWTSYELPGTP